MSVTMETGWRTPSVTPGAPLPAPNRPWTAMSASGDFRSYLIPGFSAISSMELLVLLVVVHGIANFAIHVDVAKPVEDFHDLAMAPAPTLQQRKPDPLAEHRRIGDRADIALVLFKRRTIAPVQQMGPRAQRVRFVDRPDANHLLAIVSGQPFAAGHHSPDIVLLCRHH